MGSEPIFDLWQLNMKTEHSQQSEAIVICTLKHTVHMNPKGAKCENRFKKIIES